MGSQKKKHARLRAEKQKAYRKKCRLENSRFQNEMDLKYREIFKKSSLSSEEIIIAICSGNFKTLPEGIQIKYKDLNSIWNRPKNKDRKVRFQILLRECSKKSPSLIAKEYWTKIYHLSQVSWSRSIDSWKPEGKSENAHYASLIKHLIVRYPVPAFFYNIFDRDIDELTKKFVRLFYLIAGGGSPFKTISSGIIPLKMTRKMCTFFMNTNIEIDILAALRLAQLKGLGNNIRLTVAIKNSFLGRSFMADEDFWLSVLQWFYSIEIRDYSQVAPLLDYIRHCHETVDNYSMKGRSLMALIRGMEKWHNDLAKMEKLYGILYERSGYKEGIWETKERISRDFSIPIFWTMEEIVTSKILAAEGSKMHHCVYSYSRFIERKEASIWSLKKNDESCITVEVSHRSKAIVQARGKYNRMPKSKELEIIRRWALENSLAVRI